MKFISWNIDSLNAALTGDSARALLSQNVLNTMVKHNPEPGNAIKTKLGKVKFKNIITKTCKYYISAPWSIIQSYAITIK